MAWLYSALAYRAAANGNIEASPNGLSDDLLLVLRLDVFLCQLPAAVRTLCRRGNRDHFIHLFGNMLTAMRAVSLAGLSARAASDGDCVGRGKTAPPGACWHATFGLVAS